MMTEPTANDAVISEDEETYIPEMRDYEEIIYPNGTSVFIGPVPRCYTASLELLLRKLYERWLEKQFSTAEVVHDRRCWLWMQRTAALFPRLDMPGKFGFPLGALRQDLDQLQDLFLAQIVEDKYVEPKLVRLNIFEPLEVPIWRQSDEDDEPIPSSGDPDMDLLASLTLAFNNKISEASAATLTMNAKQLDRFMFYLAELKRDPEERQKESLALDYLAWKTENQEVLDEALGIKFRFPSPSIPESIPEPILTVESQPNQVDENFQEEI